jgi:hypothetical protein
MLAMANSLVKWPNRIFVLLSMVFAFSAFATRYVGFCCFGVIAIWLLVQRNALQSAGTFRMAILTFVLLFVSCLFLLGSIVAERGSGPGLSALPSLCAHLGWSLIALPTTASVVQAATVEGSISYLLIGWMVYGLLIGFSVLSFVRNQYPHSRPFALLVLVYTVALTAANVTTNGWEHTIHSRGFYPVLFPSAILLFEATYQRYRRFLMIGTVGVALVGVALAARGVSIETSGDVKALRAILTENVMTGDKIIVNGPAAKLSIYFPNNFALSLNPSGVTDISGFRFIAVAAKRLGRTKETVISLQDPNWNAFAEELQNRGSYRMVFNDNSSFLLERNEPLHKYVNHTTTPH